MTFIIFTEISAIVVFADFKIGNGAYIVNIATLGLLEPSELVYMLTCYFMHGC
jgi:hypothetical protein